VTYENLAANLEAFDAAYDALAPGDVDLQTQSMLRVAKVAEEAGEAVRAAYLAFGFNWRKRDERPMTVVDVVTELADVAITALTAIEHFAPFCSSLDVVEERLKIVTERLPVPAEAAPDPKAFAPGDRVRYETSVALPGFANGATGEGVIAEYAPDYGGWRVQTENFGYRMFWPSELTKIEVPDPKPLPGSEFARGDRARYEVATPMSGLAKGVTGEGTIDRYLPTFDLWRVQCDDGRRRAFWERELTKIEAAPDPKPLPESAFTPGDRVHYHAEVAMPGLVKGATGEGVIVEYAPEDDLWHVQCDDGRYYAFWKVELTKIEATPEPEQEPVSPAPRVKVVGGTWTTHRGDTGVIGGDGKRAWRRLGCVRVTFASGCTHYFRSSDLDLLPIDQW